MGFKKDFAAITKLPRSLLVVRITVFSLLLIGLQLLNVSSIHRELDQKVFHPFAFWVRNQIRDPTLDPRIKIFCFDDRTAAYLHALDLSLPEWAKVINSIAKTPNVSVLIDKLFDVPYTQNDIKLFKEELRSTPNRTSVISFTHSGNIPFRNPISESTLRENQAKTVKSAELDSQQYKVAAANVYGANDLILQSFKSFGYANYSGDNRFYPFTHLDSGILLIHAALTQANSLNVSNKTVSVNEKNIHLSKDQSILIDFAPKSFYFKKTYSFLPAIELAKQGKEIPVIKPGDYVVILPAMYTGNTDFRETPYGPMAGGFHIVAILQSILSGEWLTEWEDPGVFVIAAGLLAFLICFPLKTGHALGALSSLGALLIILSSMLFIQFGTAWSFVLPFAGTMIGGISAVTLRSRVAGLEEARIIRELEVATLVQKSFFNSNISSSPDQTIKVEGIFEPANECGGDWWGQFEHGEYKYILLGDAIGHGVPAALVTAVAFTVAKTLADSREELTPLRIMSEINTILWSMASSLAAMTFYVIRIHMGSGECCYANAGNQQPFLLPKDPADKRLQAGRRSKALLARGEILGQDATLDFNEHTISLEDGDRIVLFTDGIVENRSSSTGKAYGRASLQKSINDLAHHEHKLCQHIWSAYKTACGGMERDDDATLVVIEFCSLNSRKEKTKSPCDDIGHKGF